MSHYLCPVCRLPKTADLRDGLSAAVHLQIALTSVVAAGVSFLVGGPLNAAKAAFIYLPLWAGCEFAQGIRMRRAARCVQCDFDPVLYKRDWRAARKRVEQKLGAVSADAVARTDARRHREVASRKPQASSASSASAAVTRTPEV